MNIYERMVHGAWCMVFVTRHDTQMIWTDANIYDTGHMGKKCITGYTIYIH